MKSVIVIPARYKSSRLPGKVLLKKTGKYLIQHVWEIAQQVRNKNRVIIATDNKKVIKACESFGAECMLTSSKHRSGTERAAEVCEKLDYEKIVNLQGDEPELPPRIIERVIEALDKDYMVTVSTQFETIVDRKIIDRVKVITDKKGYAVNFSRAGLLCADLHVGIYGYQRQFLMKLVKLEPTESEKEEKLEQLRVIDNGFKIQVLRLKFKSYGGIDTMSDYTKFVKRHIASQGTHV